MAIPAVIQFQHGARTVWTQSGELLVPAVDFLGAPPLADLFVQYLRRCGLQPIFLVHWYKSVDGVEDDQARVRSAVQAFNARHGLPGLLLDSSRADAEGIRKLLSQYVDALPPEAEEFHAHVDLTSFLLDRDDWARFHKETMASGKGWGGWTGLGWEYASIYNKNFWRHFVAHKGRRPDCYDLIESARYGAEFSEIRNYSMAIPAYEPLLRRLFQSDSSTLETLRALRRDEPELVFPCPRHIGVELTNEDSLPDRRRSSRRLSERPRGYLAEEHFDALLASVPGDFPGVSMDFWDFGEPLLHPRAVDWIKAAAAAGIRVDLYTNGLALDEPLAVRLLDSGVDAIFFRLDAATQETYGKVAGDAAGFARALANLETLQRLKAARLAREEPVPTLVVQLTEMPETAGDIDAFFERFDRRSRLEETLRQELGRGPSEKELVARMRAEGCMIEQAMLRHDNLMRGRVTRDASADFSPLQRFSCRQLLDGPYVLWDGRIVPCRQDYNAETVLGDLTNDLIATWRSAGVCDMLRQQTGGRWEENPLCRSCREWYYGFR